MICQYLRYPHSQQSLYLTRYSLDIFAVFPSPHHHGFKHQGNECKHMTHLTFSKYFRLHSTTAISTKAMSITMWLTWHFRSISASTAPQLYPPRQWVLPCDSLDIFEVFPPPQHHSYNHQGNECKHMTHLTFSQYFRLHSTTAITTRAMSIKAPNIPPTMAPALPEVGLLVVPPSVIEGVVVGRFRHLARRLAW